MCHCICYAYSALSNRRFLNCRTYLLWIFLVLNTMHYRLKKRNISIETVNSVTDIAVAVQFCEKNMRVVISLYAMPFSTENTAR